MRYGFDCQPIFTFGFPDSWRKRWRVIREFLDRWERRTLPDVGGGRQIILETETRLGLALPPSLRQWVAFAFDVRGKGVCHCVLRDIYQMQDLKGFSALSLLLQ